MATRRCLFSSAPKSRVSRPSIHPISQTPLIALSQPPVKPILVRFSSERESGWRRRRRLRRPRWLRPHQVGKVLWFQKVSNRRKRSAKGCETLTKHEKLLCWYIGEIIASISKESAGHAFGMHVMSPLLDSLHIDGWRHPCTPPMDTCIMHWSRNKEFIARCRIHSTPET